MTTQEIEWPRLRRAREIFKVPEPDPEQEATRLKYMEVYIGLPVKTMVVLLLLYYFYFSRWYREVVDSGPTHDILPYEFGLDVVREFFLVYLIFYAATTSVLLGMSQVSLKWVRAVAFNSAWVDILFLSMLVFITGGYDSMLYWAYLGLIARHSVSMPAARKQFTLNSLVILAYMGSGALEAFVNEYALGLTDANVRRAIDTGPQEMGAEPVFLRVLLLMVVTTCIFGVQVLRENQRRADEEAREFAVRQAQLQSTGRLAAEIAHQLKNPLGIINNASFSLQRTVKDGKAITRQLEIIREEVERSDRIITELMGYAQLTEGAVERLDVREELDRAIEQVFPKGANYNVEIERQYGSALPPLLMQRGHLQEIFLNLLQNAREAMGGVGAIRVGAQYGSDYSVIVTIADNGPGIEPEHLEKVFEAYFTTKPRGSGLGLSIVRHNTEIYNGSVLVESELGKGTTFTIRLPAKTLMTLRR